MDENKSLVVVAPVDITGILNSIASRERSTEIVRRSLEIAHKIDLMKPITPFDIARASGFNDAEMATMRMFMDPVFNEGRVYLSRGFIAKYLIGGSDKGINVYYRDVLCAKYQLGRDYFILDPNDSTDKQLIDSYENIGIEISIPKTQSTNTRGGSNKRYYAVSCDCLKDLIMRSSTALGTQLRAHLIRIEKLVPIYDRLLNIAREIIREQEIRTIKIQNESEKKLIMDRAQHEIENSALEAQRVVEESHAREEAATQAAAEAQAREVEAQARAEASAREADALRRKQVRMKALPFPIIPPSDNGSYFYIATSAQMAPAHHYKIGCTACLTARLSGYQTGRPSTDPIFFVYIRACNNAYTVEKQIKDLLKQFCENTRADTELFIMRFDALRAIVDAVVDGSLRATAILRDYVAHRDEICADDDPHIPSPIELPTREPVPAVSHAPRANARETPEEARRRLLPRVLAAFTSVTGTNSASSSAGPSGGSVGSTAGGAGEGSAPYREVDENDVAIAALIAELRADRRAIHALHLEQRRTIKTLIERVLEDSKFELVIRKVKKVPGTPGTGPKSTSKVKRLTIHVRAQH